VSGPLRRPLTVCAALLASCALAGVDSVAAEPVWTPHTRAAPVASSPRARAAVLLRREFGTRLGACFLSIAKRETGGTYDPRAANYADRHSDGSYGSFGLLQIGAIHRGSAETIIAFRNRMWIPENNVRLGHALYRRSGLRPWGGYF